MTVPEELAGITGKRRSLPEDLKSWRYPVDFIHPSLHC
jgi:hypothetical protein